GVRRSVGQIHWDLNHFTCRHPRCPCVPAGEPAAAQRAGQAPAVHQHESGGSLTGQLASG
ncbi:MAG: hypothetical protein J2P32_11745, partial [Actinobacteria bacterium]|nr:hypothetical protein [Actinomycetota bacterium]